jgi:gamma-glutamylcyclotransferase (GGCT)/AIG2-like uncharacterized protein YtfP
VSVLPHLFVYGTLRPGDVRWSFLEPWVIGAGFDDAVPGRLFDTGLDYPAAVFGAGGTVVGRTYELGLATLHEALRVIDEEEDTVLGLYRRVEVRTTRGLRAWAYEYGSGLELTPIASGDWFARSPGLRSPELLRDRVHRTDVGLDLGVAQGRAQLDRDADAVGTDHGA